jgi:hypothetical protein
MSKVNGRLSGNAGEFSEAYVVARLLVDGMVPVIDSKEKRSGAFIRIHGIKRTERDNKCVYIQRGDSDYNCTVNEVTMPARSYVTVSELTSKLLDEIKTGKSDPSRKATPLTFYCPSAEALLGELFLSGLKAKSGEKADLELSIRDLFSVNGVRGAGFTIKSMLGSAPSLTNSGATIFRYKVSCENSAMLDDLVISDISGKPLIRKLMDLPGFRYDFLGVESEAYADNLRMIDTLFAPMLAAALFQSYQVVGGRFASIFEDGRFLGKLKEVCGADDNLPFFIHKFKDFLKQSALGMQPKKRWGGSNDVTGGALIVQPDGQVVCLCTDRDSDFRDYLFENCHFETPSSGDGASKLCAVRKDENGNFLIRLSLQIRFKKS